MKLISLNYFASRLFKSFSLIRALGVCLRFWYQWTVVKEPVKPLLDPLFYARGRRVRIKPWNRTPLNTPAETGSLSPS